MQQQWINVMKDLMMKTRMSKVLSAGLGATVLSAAMLIAAPFNEALAADPPYLGKAGNFAVLAGSAVTCTNSTVSGGNVGVWPGTAITKTNCIIDGKYHPGDKAAKKGHIAFLRAYNALTLRQCDYILPGALGGVTLYQPGVYCVDAASTTTAGTLTLVGSPNDVWIFKIGTIGTGALTGTGFNVVMPGGDPCNLYWWVAQAATMTTSSFQGTILAGAAITITGGTFNGDALAMSAVTMTGAAVNGCAP
jgi:hypothetical protein